ncbi:ATP-dependent Clp protease ATP-binding subunit [compost metagenome]
MNRAIQKHLEDPIAEEILKGELQDGDVMEVGVDKETNEIKINVLKEARKRKKKEEDNLS